MTNPLDQFLRLRTELTLVKQLSGAPLHGKLLALPGNVRWGWKGLPRTKHSSLLQKFVNDGKKCFIRLAPGRRWWPEVGNRCRWRRRSAARNRASGQSLPQYGRPETNVIKLFTVVIYRHSMVILSFCVMKQHYLGHYCGMGVNYCGICVTNVIKHDLTKNGSNIL